MTKHLFVIRSKTKKLQVSRKVVRRNDKAGRETTGKGSLRPAWSAGLLFNKHAAWVGCHYSAACHRWCINIVPCFTFWLRGAGGHEP